MKELTSYEKAYRELPGFRQKVLLARLNHGNHIYFGLQVHVNPILIDVEVSYLKEKLKDYNFKITGDTNSETITIK